MSIPGGRAEVAAVARVIGSTASCRGGPAWPAARWASARLRGGVIQRDIRRGASAPSATCRPAPGGLDARQAHPATRGRDLYQSGLKIVSCYQYGKQDTADWLGGQTAGVQHAKRGWQLHVAAGGSYGAPIYASIDDDPSLEQYKQQVAPYLRGWEAVLGHQRVGVYANSQDHRLGPAGRPRRLLLAAQLGLAEGVHPSRRAPASGRDRQAQRRWRRRRPQPRAEAALRAVGLKPYRSVSFASKLISAIVRSTVDIRAPCVDFSGDVAGRRVRAENST